MLLLYRNVWIILLQDEQLTIELTDFATGEPLPTKVVAGLGEDAEGCLHRARALVDLYKGAPYCTTRSQRLGANIRELRNAGDGSSL